MGLPEYISDFTKQLLAAQAWIDKGGPDTSTHAGPVSITGMTMGHVQLTVEAASDGKSEVDATDEGSGGQEHLMVPKVWSQDHVWHVLNKGQWTETPAVCQGWKIFVQVSSSFLTSGDGTDPLVLGCASVVTNEMCLLFQAWAQMFQPGQTHVWSLSV